MVEKYYWIYDEYKFELVIGFESSRFDDEGIFQQVILFLNNKIIANSSFGRLHMLKLLTNSIYSISDEFIDVDSVYIDANKRYMNIKHNSPEIQLTIKNNDFVKFYLWLVESLTPLNIKRIKKINNIQKNIKLLGNKV